MRPLRMAALGLLAVSLAVAATPPRAAAKAPGTLILPAGTPVEIQLETAISSADAQEGDHFAGLVTRSVYVHGRRAIPHGSIIEGTVREVVDRRVATGASALLLHPDFLALPDGQRYRINAEITQALAATGVRVGSEGELTAPRGMQPGDVHRAELAGGGGLAAGALVAGAQGALIGTGIGAGIAVGWWLLSHRHAALNQGAILEVRLDHPVALSPASAGGAPLPAPRLRQRGLAAGNARAVGNAPKGAAGAKGGLAAAQSPEPSPAAAPAYAPPPKPTVENLPAPAVH